MWVLKMSEFIFHMNQSPVNILGILSSFGSDDKQERGCPLPADPLQSVMGSPEGWAGIPPVPPISGDFACATIVFPPVQRRISEIFYPHYSAKSLLFLQSR